MTTPAKTVALLDSRWIGHHPTYFREFLASLLRLEVRVIALCPEPEKFAKVVEEVCRELGRNPEEWVVTGMFTSPAKSFLVPGMDHDPLSAMWRWFAAGRALRRAERGAGWKADLVFFPWLDSYLRFLPHWRWTEWTLARPWAGLYFRNHHLSPEWLCERGDSIRGMAFLAKGDLVLRAPQCRAVGVLDERFAPALGRVCGKPVIAFPDVANMTFPKEETKLVGDIAARAGKRRIIGMIGLEKRKGFLTLLKTAVRCSESSPWYFVFGGALKRDSFSKEELEWIEVVARTAKDHGELDNLWLDIERPALDEPAFNALMKSFDVVFAAYEDFSGSSNTLTKAAYLEKPVIVSKGECMEKRVRDYDLGICVEQGSAEGTVEAIKMLLEGKNEEGKPLRTRFEEYRQAHSHERLDEVFREVLAKTDRAR